MFVDCKPFKLIEYRAVRRVVVAPVHFAGRNNADGRLLFLHNARLHRARLRAQNHVVVDVERVLHIACGMVFGDVEKLEVVQIAFNFRTFRNRKAHAGKYVDKFARDERKRMKRAEFGRVCGESHVNLLRFEPFKLLRLFDKRGLFVEHAFNGVSQFVDHFAHIGAFFFRDVCHISHKQRYFTAFAEIFHSDVGKLLTC